MSGERKVLCGRGDCVSSIAARFGVSPQAIWDYPDNAELRQLRGNPNVLLAGDPVVVPTSRGVEATGQTGRANRYVVSLPTTRLRVRLLGGGAPRRAKSYTLVLEDETERKGTTDGDGVLDERVPARARTVTVRMESDLGVETYQLRLGHLDPASEPSGVQQRLANLGFHCATTGALDEDTAAALALFQESEGLEPTGAADQRTRDALVRAHGS